jgi:predicted MPP superfamily phosphohydrolase
MKRVVWLTDVHLNFLNEAQARGFLQAVAEARPDGVLVGGDIAESHDVCEYLALFREIVPAPIYFVLGNHDYYHGSISETRRHVADYCAERPGLHYLTVDHEPHELSPHVGLIGHDGWADGRTGDFARSMVSMMDYRLIAELSARDKRQRLKMLQTLGDEAAAHIRDLLPKALASYRDAMLLTHVPPWRAACWYDGAISDDEWSPHFTCVAMGEAISEIMAEHPEHRLTVLCGHTHGRGECQPLANVQVFTGGAEYGQPTIQRVFEFD